MTSFPCSFHTHTDPRLSSGIRQLGTPGAGHPVHFRPCLLSQQKCQIFNLKKSTSGPSQDLRTDCQFQDSSDTPLALTQSLILSNPTLKPKGCLVYQGLPLYSGQNGLQNAPSTLCGWPRLQCLASTRESVFVQTRQPLDLLLFLVQPPKPAGRMPRGGSSRVTGSVPSLQDRSESHSLPRGRVSSCARISHI